ncbi:MAG: terminase family protein [Deltaproteobacteria bacterium]|nr:terminase family protein [Deltaproteobacteria bacterium]
MGYFLPYQEAWLADNSRLKIAEKSRRIGFTYVQAYEDVRDACLESGALDVWFSSADESAAKEYILYCSQWAKVLNIAAQDLGEVVIDNDRDIKALAVQLANGKRLHGLTSNPAAFRSKGGKLVLDEFAFHKDPDALWKAAAPIITWGYPARVISTYNGKGNRYARMVADARKGNKWSLHTVTIEDAVAQGLVDRIMGRKATPEEVAAFLADCRDIAGDEETYLQEYMCVPVDEATAWLTWELITGAEHPQAGRPEFYQGGDAYVGMDIGRRRDLTVIWVDELVGDIDWTREVISLKNKSFAQQADALDGVMRRYNVVRVCMDQTGMGMAPVEAAQALYGNRVEGVMFSGPVKQDLATVGKQRFEDKRVRIPADRAIRDSHHAVRKLTTSAGNPRFDADRSEAGHADEFWAHMLALHAAGQPAEPWDTARLPRQHLNQLLRGY